MASSWRAEDLLDLERCGLAADLASTNLDSGGSGSGWGQGAYPDQEIEVDTYDFSEVLDNLLDNKSLGLSNMATPTHPLNLSSTMETHTLLSSSMDTPHSNQRGAGPNERFEAVLKAPSAYGIKTDQHNVTYLNKGYSYEVELRYLGPISSAQQFKGTLTLSFCELRWLNSQSEHFHQWSKDHPQERLLEIDSIGCAGLVSVDESGSCHNRVHFVCTQANGVLAIRINCLSTEFAAKKHGGERGVPLKLHLELCEGEGQRSVYQGMCWVKVFKDKGGDRKQRQDQSKMEKLPPEEQAKYHSPESITVFMPLPPDGCGLQQPSFISTPQSADNCSISLTPAASPYHLPQVATPPSATPTTASSSNAAASFISISACLSVEETQKWLLLNRFGQYLSLFANYTGQDLLCMSRQDLMDLCGHADGIRLYNSLQSRVLKTLYVRFKEDNVVYQAICLQELSAQELLARILAKLSWLEASQVASFIRLTSSGLLVRIDDTVVQALQQEGSFLLQTVKEESGCFQLVLQDCVSSLPNDHQISLSLSGSAKRH